MRYLFYTIVPLLVLLAAISLACIVGYFVVQGIGDVVPFPENHQQIDPAIPGAEYFPGHGLPENQQGRARVCLEPGIFKTAAMGIRAGFYDLDARFYCPVCA